MIWLDEGKKFLSNSILYSFCVRRCLPLVLASRATVGNQTLLFHLSFYSVVPTWPLGFVYLRYYGQAAFVTLFWLRFPAIAALRYDGQGAL